jgi:hypothetical protein
MIVISVLSTFWRVNKEKLHNCAYWLYRFVGDGFRSNAVEVTVLRCGASLRVTGARSSETAWWSHFQGKRRISIALFDSRRWHRHAVSKRRAPITQSRGTTSHSRTEIITVTVHLFTCKNSRTAERISRNLIEESCKKVWGYAVAQLVEALSYKPEGRGFYSRWSQGIFQWLNPSGRIVALGSTQPLAEMSTRNPSWGQRRPVRTADNLATFMCRLSRNSGSSTSWNPKGVSRPVAGKLYL